MPKFPVRVYELPEVGTKFVPTGVVRIEAADFASVPAAAEAYFVAQGRTVVRLMPGDPERPDLNINAIELERED